MDVTELANDAGQLLAVAVAGLAQPGSTPAPARRYVSWTIPVEDCEQLTVHLSALTPRLAPKQSCAMQTIATWCVELWRCVPKFRDQRGNPPLPADLTASADGLLTDTLALWSYLSQRRKDGTLIVSYGCSQIELKPVTFLAPRGGFAGVRICLDVTLAGLVTGS